MKLLLYRWKGKDKKFLHLHPVIQLSTLSRSQWKVGFVFNEIFILSLQTTHLFFSLVFTKFLAI